MTAILLGVLALMPVGLIAFLPLLLPVLPVTAAVFLSTTFGRDIFAIIVVAIAVLIAWLVFSTHYYNEGWNAHKADELRRNEQAIARANDAEQKMRLCEGAGGQWDAEGRRCVR